MLLQVSLPLSTCSCSLSHAHQCRYPGGKAAEIIKGVYTDVLDPLFASALGTTLPEGWPESCPPLPPICPQTTAASHMCNDPSHRHAEL